MAAGVGSRISRHIKGPKCLVNVAGKPLIERTINSLIRNNIKDITITVGYKKSLIEDSLKSYDIKYYENPFYNDTNSIASLRLALQELDDDLILMNGDVLFEDKLIDRINSLKHTAVFADSIKEFEDMDYKLRYKNGILKGYGKELTKSETSGEYVGVAVIKRDSIDRFKKELLDMIETGNLNAWWEDVLYSLSEKEDIFIEDLKGEIFWGEVDFIEDYEKILQFFKKERS